jgi:hypothetical protein
MPCLLRLLNPPWRRSSHAIHHGADKEHGRRLAITAVSVGLLFGELIAAQGGYVCAPGRRANRGHNSCFVIA